MLRDEDIFSNVEHKNKQTKDGLLLCFLFISIMDTQQTDTAIFSELSSKIVFTKITSRISKPLIVFNKLGLVSKYRGGQRFSTQSEKKMQRHRGAQIK